MTPPTSSRRRRSRPAPVVMRPSVTLRATDETTYTVEPTIVQRFEHTWFGLGNSESLCYEALEHRFDLVLPRDAFDLVLGVASSDEDEDDADRRWDALTAAYALPEDAHKDDRHRRIREDEDELWLAYLDLHELPTHLAAPGDDWYNALDRLGPPFTYAIDLVQALSDGETLEGGSLALIGGALIWPQMLGVHPRARGQEIGIRLLAHALWAVQRSTSDVAVLQAATVRSLFDATTPTQTPESYRALSAYYGRLGFTPWRPRAAIGSAVRTILYRELGERGLNAATADGGALL